MPKIVNRGFTQRHKGQQGFTLIELLLVVVIIGVLLAVIVPRAWRANVDAKYGVVRQNCTELAAFANQWAEHQLEVQDDDSTSTISAYFNSLTRGGSNLQGNYFDSANGQWIGKLTSNWNIRANQYGVPMDNMAIEGRKIGEEDNTRPESTVEELIPPERLPRNPFTGASMLRESPGDGSTKPGMTAAGRARDGEYGYYALVFQGTDSSASTQKDGYNNNPDVPDVFHAGMELTIEGLRNGIFMARLGLPPDD